MMLNHAEDCIARCRALALHTEEPGFTTRTFLSPWMHAVHGDLIQWMRDSGMSVSVDAVGNLRGRYAPATADAPVFWIGSHLDTVPHAGAFDGILGVVLGVKLVQLLSGHPLPFAIEVVGFSEEEGVRFGFPFIGSLALIGQLNPAATALIAGAVRDFGLNPTDPVAMTDASLGYLEFHIEQGPVLENLGLPLGIVEAIAGQTRMQIIFEGKAGHAGTTPMNLRHDALACAAEWICEVEEHAGKTFGMVATVGKLEVHPGAPNVIPGTVKLTLDVRHQMDATRRHGAASMLDAAHRIAHRRGLSVSSAITLDQAAVPLDAQLAQALARAVERSGHAVHCMMSGAGHDAMVIARAMPAAMLFLRSPGGLSHHPEESVLVEDVASALSVGMNFLENLA